MVRGVDGESTGGPTTFRFTVTRTGGTSGESSAAWAVAGRGPNALGASDFVGAVLPSGTVRFRPGETSRTIRVQVLADPEQDQARRFNLTLSEPSGATLGAVLAKGALAKGNLVGSGGADQFFGSRASEVIHGGAGRDLLTGSGGADVFSFRYGDSPITAPDRITDHTLGVDKIAIRNRQGNVQARPLAFSRAADNSTATTLEELAAAVFADADGLRQGAQKLGRREAAVVRATGEELRGTYLLVNDNRRPLNPGRDLLIEITGFNGRLPGVGTIDPSAVFA